MKQTVLVYIEENNKYLMLYRNKKEKDINKNKYIGIGGHVEDGETPDVTLIREVKEETGLKLLSFIKRGIVYFVLNGYVEEMHVYTSNNFEGEMIECNEGELIWINKNEVLNLPIWAGDKYFLKHLLEDDKYFTMKLVYEDDNLVEVIEEQ